MKQYLVEDFGLLFQVSKPGWKKFLALRASGKGASLAQCGAKPLGPVDVRLADLRDPDDYRACLEALPD